MREFSQNLRDRVFARWGSTCAYCKQPYHYPGRQRTIDHLIPRSRGGSKRLDNLVGCCHACNVAKGCRTPKEWLAELTAAIREIQAVQDIEVIEPAAVLA